MELKDWLILAAAGFVVAALVLSWDKIKNWFQQNIRHDTSHGILVLKEALKNGNYTVVQGVINRSNEITAATEWRNVKLEQNLLSEFDSRGILTVNLQ